jgi:hypothetical protein
MNFYWSMSILICADYTLIILSISHSHQILTPYAYRLLQDRVDMLEAEKDSHVNKIADLRSLLRKVNQEGEKRVTFIRNKNVSVVPLTNLSL